MVGLDSPNAKHQPSGSSCRKQQKRETSNLCEKGTKDMALALLQQEPSQQSEPENNPPSRKVKRMPPKEINQLSRGTGGRHWLETGPTSPTLSSLGSAAWPRGCCWGRGPGCLGATGRYWKPNGQPPLHRSLRLFVESAHLTLYPLYECHPDSPNPSQLNYLLSIFNNTSTTKRKLN